MEILNLNERYERIVEYFELQGKEKELQQFLEDTLRSDFPELIRTYERIQIGRTLDSPESL